MGQGESNNLKDMGFLIENSGDKKKMAQQFSNTERKLSIQPPMGSKNILHDCLKMKIFSYTGKLREFVVSGPIIKNV